MGTIYIFEKENMDIANIIQCIFFFFCEKQKQCLIIYKMNTYYKNVIVTLKTKVMFGNRFSFLFSKLVFGNIKKKQFSCIFEIKNIFG